MRATAFEGFIFVIDTDTYAGNFERPMCAYLTGRVGECGVGGEMAEKFKEECPEWVDTMDDLVVSVPDDHGCFRPASIYPTRGFWNDGMGNEWPDEDWGKPHVLEAFHKAVKRHGRPEDLVDASQPGKYPSYQSVAIFLDKGPSEDVLGLWLRRAKAFPGVHASAQEWNSPFKILGFRLVQERVEVVEVASYPAT